MIFEFDRFELDLRLCELRKDGAPHHVEPQVFDVLTHLVRHRDRLVTRDELLDQVWGHRYVTPSALSARIKDARKALGDDGRAQRIIRTVRGRGFRFIPEVRERDEEEDSTGPGTDPVASSPAFVPPGPIRVGPHGIGSVVGPASTTRAVPRRAELRCLRGILDLARAGSRQLVFVSGPSGVGKTVLLDGFMSEAAATDEGPGEILVGWGQCLDQSGPGEAYLPILDAFGRLCRSSAGARIRAALASHAPSWLLQMPALLTAEEHDELARRVGAHTRERMLRELVELVEALAADVPLLLLLEDVHWSDPSTLDFLLWLARRPDPARLMVVATCRGDEAGPELRDLLGRVRGTSGLTELELPPWGRGEIRELLEARFAARAFPEGISDVILSRTAGNPLFVTSLVDAWVEGGRIRESGGTWKLDGDPGELARELPDSLRAFLQARLDRIPLEGQRILEGASVVGPTFSCAALAGALERSEEEVEDACLGLVRETAFVIPAGEDDWPDGTRTALFAFTHDLVRDVLYERIPLSRRSGLHERAGSRIEASFGGAHGDERVGELAVHFERARDDRRAVRYLLLAARKAAGRSAPHEAIGHLESALAIVRRRRDLPDRLRTELEIQQLLAPALLEVRGWSDPAVEAAYERGRTLAGRLEDPEALGRALYGLAYLHEFRGEFPTAQALVRERLELSEEADPNRFRLETYDLLSCSLLHEGAFGRSLENAERAVALAEEDGGVGPTDLGHHPVVSSHYWAGLAHWFLGRPDRGLELVRRARRIAEGVGHVYSLAFAETRLARINRLRREVEAAATHAGAALDLSREHGFPYQRALASTVLGWSQVVAEGAGKEPGVVEEGIARIREGLDEQRAMGAVMDLPYGLGLMADALLAAGRPEEARRIAIDALAAVHRGAGSYFWEAELLRLEAMASLALGEEDRAKERLEAALRTARTQGSRSLELRAALSLCRLSRQGRGRPDPGATDRLRRVFEGFAEGFGTPDLREAGELLCEGEEAR